jgi:trimethylamine:corrinoid methyltransferase-like protein
MDAVGFMHRGVLVKGQEVKVMETIAEHCKKPVYISGVESDEGIALAKKLYNQRGNYILHFAIINSPLNVIQGMITPFLKAVREGIPISLSTMPMAGLSAPYSLSGLLTLTHAEILFGLTLIQVMSPGLTVVHSGLPSIANIQKNYSVDLGLISHNVANLLMEKVCARLELPAMHSGCTTSAESPGKEAENDAIRAYGLFKKHGFHQIRHSFGFLKELVSFSMEKLERHAAICAETGPEHAPDIVIDPFDEEGFEVIMRNGSNPNYMKDDHTLKNTGRVFLQ